MLTASQTFTLTIDNHLVIPSPFLGTGVQNLPYSSQLQAAGGTLPYIWSLDASSPPLPSGLSLDGATGIVSGSPAGSGYFSIRVDLSDSATPAATTASWVNFQINPPLAFSTSKIPDGSLGYYFQFVGIIGGLSPYTVKLTKGALPDGLSLQSDQYNTSIQGNATATGLFSFTLEAKDSYSTQSTVTQDFQVRISPPLQITGGGSVNLYEGQTYSFTLGATGGFPPYTWGAYFVPPGFAFDLGSQTLSGTAQTPGTYGYGIFVRDSSSPPLQAAVYGNVRVLPKLRLSTGTLPPIATGRSVWVRLAAIGGNNQYQWAVSQGSLPPGLTFDPASGAISGSATTAGTYTFDVSVTDSSGSTAQQTATQSITWTVSDPAQMTRNDDPVHATPISNLELEASLSPYSDPSTSAQDVDWYAITALPGKIVYFYVYAGDHSGKYGPYNSLLPVLEIEDANGSRYSNCSTPQPYFLPQQYGSFDAPCVTGLAGASNIVSFNFQVPGSGTTPVTFYLRVLDARGDARPDFVYTLGILNQN
jgi:hypothetical protein